MENSAIGEPLEFIFSGKLFIGLSGNVNNKDIVITSEEDAFSFAFQQDVPAGYSVWIDHLENKRKELRRHSDFNAVEEFVTQELVKLQTNHSALQLEYRKKKVKKTNTPLDDFMFSEARENAFFVLSVVAINRGLSSSSPDDFIEKLFDYYKLGGWPCGKKDQSIIVFDPASLKD